MNLAALVAYDGTRFAGFQRQPPERGATIQGALEQAFQQIAGVAVTVEAAGRTDSGVHASGQVVNAQVPDRLDVRVWQRGLNALLPADIAIRDVCVVGEKFRARRCALSRTYRYHILVDAVRSPLEERFAWRVSHTLDVDAMREAAEVLLGEHDFAAFGSSPADQRGTGRHAHTVRAMLAVSCAPVAAASGNAHGVEVTFTANAFLSGMVRRLIGTLVLVGEHRLTTGDFHTILEARDKAHPGAAAPAHGLCLTNVEYPADSLQWQTGQQTDRYRAGRVMWSET